jgi:hypothetical protein
MLTYAIGDIHGCLRQLRDLLGDIDRHAAGGVHRLVFLGDLIDRGPDSAGVIRRCAVFKMSVRQARWSACRATTKTCC